MDSTVFSLVYYLKNLDTNYSFLYDAQFDDVWKSWKK